MAVVKQTGGNAGNKMTLENSIQEEDDKLHSMLDYLIEKVPARDEKWTPSPATLQDAVTAYQAKALRDDKKKKDKKQELDFKKISNDPQNLLSAANAAGVPKEVLQYAIKSLPYGSKVSDDDSRSIFWKVMDDYFRRAKKEDLKLLRSLIVDTKQDKSFKNPTVGKKYYLQWQDEEQYELSTREISSPILAIRNKPSTSQAENNASNRSQAQIVSISSVLSPKENSAENSELCDVCFEGESTSGNLIIFCDSCNVGVHQTCYGVPSVPEGPWLCRKCAIRKEKGKQVTCVLCPVRHGALKPIHPNSCVTASGEKSNQQEWIHLFCSQWIPETYIRAEDTVNMEPVQNVAGVSKERFKLLCSICKQRQGACIQCSHGHCTTAFHPLCARAAGLLMEVVGYDGSDNIELKAYCQKHSKRPTRRALTELESTKSKKKGIDTNVQDDGSKASAQTNAVVCKAEEPERNRIRAIDMLGEVPDTDIRILARQLHQILGVKVQQIASDMGLDCRVFESWLEDKAELSSEQIESIRRWIRDYANNLFNEYSEEEKVDKGDGTSMKEASAPYSMSLYAKSLPKIPKRFEIDIEEYDHLYIENLLKNCNREGNVELQKRGSGQSGPIESNIRNDAVGATDFKWTISEELAQVIAGSPDDETLSEMFMIQHQLAKQLVSNRNKVSKLINAVKDKILEEEEYFSKLEEDKKIVKKFVEAFKESKRLLKRERRAEQQKEILAAAEAAVASSTRYSAGRKIDDDLLKMEEKQDYKFENYIPNIYVKDSSGRDVIYDKYSIKSPDQDILCAVCGHGNSEKPNEIIFCEMCDLAVHQKCYGVSAIPEGDWLCWPCKEYEQEMLKLGKPKSAIRKPRWQGGDMTAIDNVQCSLCPVKRGAFKKTTDGEWLHVICAMCQPEVQISDENVAQAASSIKNMAPNNDQFKCFICSQSVGKVVKCNYAECSTYFHPLCARAAGFYMPTDPGLNINSQIYAYCDKHGHLAQQQLVQKNKATNKIPPILQDHIHWLETNFVKLRHTRQELEKLRIICDVVMKRERTKGNLLKADQLYMLKSLQRPGITRDFEEKLKDPEFAKGIVDSENTQVLKRKKWSPFQTAENQENKRMMVDRERVMTINQAQATNNKLPAGYLYVPLDYSKKNK